MSDFRKKVLVGNIVLHPDIIQQFLIKADYNLLYDTPKDKLTLIVGEGGFDEKVLFEIRNVPHESALKLAEGLGLKHISSNELLCVWSNN
jgi:hypothetical protein